MKINFYVIIFLSLLAATFVIPQSGGSDNPLNPVSTSLGKTYISNTRGVFALGHNPANISLEENNFIEFSTIFPLPNLDFRGGTDFLSLDEFNYFFGGAAENGETKGRLLDQNDRDRLNNLFSDGGLFFVNASLNIFSLMVSPHKTIGSFGISVQERIAGQFNFPQGLIKFFFQGNPLGSVYNFDDASVKSWWLRDYSFTYSRSLDEIPQNIFEEITFGVTLKYVQGFYYIGTEYVRSKIETKDDYTITGSGDVLIYSAFSPAFGVEYSFNEDTSDSGGGFTPFPEPAGTGIGFDFGASFNYKNYLYFGIALTDVGSIKWNKGTAQFVSKNAVVIDEITNTEKLDSLVNSFTGEAAPIAEFKTPLATSLGIGVTLLLHEMPYMNKFFGRMRISFDMNLGFNNQPRNSKHPRFSIGAEYKPIDWVPYLRTGFSFESGKEFGWGVGIGFDMSILEIDLATSNFQTLVIPNAAKTLAFTIGSRWKF